MEHNVKPSSSSSNLNISRVAISRVQALVRQYVPGGRQLSAELIQQRREESQHE